MQVDWVFVAYFLLLILLILLFRSDLCQWGSIFFRSHLRTTCHRGRRRGPRPTHRSAEKPPKRLLATILIGNNFVNIAIVIVSKSSSITSSTNRSSPPLAGGCTNTSSSGFYTRTIGYCIDFFITVILDFYPGLLFGEVGPKIYANVNNLKGCENYGNTSKLLGFFLFTPVSSILVRWDKPSKGALPPTANYQDGSSREDLDAAIELTVSQNEEEPHEARIAQRHRQIWRYVGPRWWGRDIGCSGCWKNIDFTSLLQHHQKVVTPDCRLRRRCR